MWTRGEQGAIGTAKQSEHVYPGVAADKLSFYPFRAPISNDHRDREGHRNDAAQQSPADALLNEALFCTVVLLIFSRYLHAQWNPNVASEPHHTVCSFCGDFVNVLDEK